MYTVELLIAFLDSKMTRHHRSDISQRGHMTALPVMCTSNMIPTPYVCSKSWKVTRSLTKPHVRHIE